ncbi:MAG: VWA domain-containing protein [Methylophaga sp.]|nr:VWA domain-containing protein [Methylophaga sp.]
MRLSYQQRIIASALAMIIAVVLIAAALWFPKIDRTVKVMDILFVLDITQSMDVEDVEVAGDQVSRLTWAKDYTQKTLVDLPCGSHVGLAVFSEYRSLVLINPVEVCANYNDLKQMIAKISGSMAWALSSEVSKATFEAIKQAKLIEPNPSIVFITDGHESPPLHKTLFAKFRGKPGEVPGVFVGIGGDDLLAIPKHSLDGEDLGVWQVNDVLHQDVYASGRGDMQEQNALKAKTEHLSSQKKVHIKRLATMVGFDYVLSPSSPSELINKVQNVAATRDQMISYSWAPWLAGLALLLLIVLYFPTQYFRRNI